ncbi:MAG: hypothetical protein KDD69_12440 [Bdellovibrionales bacterium]|nr:hypothetical protein [Bdellovibrionales bacterium]
MQHTQLQKSLESIGLNEKQAALYLAALQLGGGSVQQLARHASIKRTSAYHVLNSLEEQGLMSKELRGIKECYVAKDPELLEELLRRRRDEFLRTLPYLQSLQHFQQSDSIIRVFEGLERVEEAYWEMLDSIRSGEDYLVLGNLERWTPLISDAFAQTFVRRRGRLPIRVRMLLCTGPVAIERKGKKRQPNEETRLLPPSATLTTNLVILPRRLFVHQYESPYTALVIENDHIIRMHREMFEIMWRGLQ